MKTTFQTQRNLNTRFTSFKVNARLDDRPPIAEVNRNQNFEKMRENMIRIDISHKSEKEKNEIGDKIYALYQSYTDVAIDVGSEIQTLEDFQDAIFKKLNEVEVVESPSDEAKALN